MKRATRKTTDAMRREFDIWKKERNATLIVWAVYAAVFGLIAIVLIVLAWR